MGGAYNETIQWKKEWRKWMQARHTQITMAKPVIIKNEQLIHMHSQMRVKNYNFFTLFSTTHYSFNSFNYNVDFLYHVQRIPILKILFFLVSIQLFMHLIRYRAFDWFTSINELLITQWFYRKSLSFVMHNEMYNECVSSFIYGKITEFYL